MAAKNEGYPLVSIVIPVYNGANYLREAIDSALNQTYPNCEILVINDGSDDGGETERAALSYGDRIRYFAKENGHVSTALNMGIRNMRGEYFAWLSHDDVFYPDKIEKQLRVMEENGVRIVAAAYRYFMDSGRKIAFCTTECYGREWLENSVFPVIHGMVHFGCILLHRSLFDKYGVFREDLFTTQDYEFLFRILRKETCVFMDAIVNGVRVHPRQVGNTSPYMDRERDKMYEMFLRELSGEEQIRIYGSPYNFFYQILARLVPMRNMPISFAACAERLNRYEGQGGHVLEGEAVYIYGAGLYGRRLLFDLRCRGIEVRGFLDKSDALNGRVIDGIPCYPLAQAKNIAHDAVIIIASEYREEMAEALRGMGITGYIYKEEYEKKHHMLRLPPPEDAVRGWLLQYQANGWR